MTLDWRKLRNEIDDEREAEQKAKIRKTVRELKTPEGLRVISPLARLVKEGLKRPVYTHLVLGDAHYAKGLQYLKKGENERAANSLKMAVSEYANLFNRQNTPYSTKSEFAKRAYRAIGFIRRYDNKIAGEMYSTWERKVIKKL